jgi:hypothetical protein
MTETVIYVRASHEAVLRALRTLPQRICGGGVIQETMLTHAGTALLDHIQEAFAVKSQGGTDAAGESWKPLHPRTIAYRRAKRSSAERGRPTHPSQALTAAQQDRWWTIYRQQLARFRGNKSAAAKVAWVTLRSEGAHTLLDKYANEKVDILRDTNELMDSLTPNSGSSKSVFRISAAQVELGTTRIGALSHHRGDPSRNLPQRRLWPEPRNFPPAWWRGILCEVQDGVVEIVKQVVHEAAGQ